MGNGNEGGDGAGRGRRGTKVAVTALAKAKVPRSRSPSEVRRQMEKSRSDRRAVVRERQRTVQGRELKVVRQLQAVDMKRRAEHVVRSRIGRARSGAEKGAHTFDLGFGREPRWSLKSGWARRPAVVLGVVSKPAWRDASTEAVAARREREERRERTAARRRHAVTELALEKKRHRVEKAKCRRLLKEGEQHASASRDGSSFADGALGGDCIMHDALSMLEDSAPDGGDDSISGRCDIDGSACGRRAGGSSDKGEASDSHRNTCIAPERLSRVGPTSHAIYPVSGGSCQAIEGSEGKHGDFPPNPRQSTRFILSSQCDKAHPPESERDLRKKERVKLLLEKLSGVEERAGNLERRRRGSRGAESQAGTTGIGTDKTRLHQGGGAKLVLMSVDGERWGGANNRKKRTLLATV